jgi:hypothetical protein
MTINTEEQVESKGGKTFQYQDKLPKLPIPDLNDTIKRYLAVLAPLLVTIHFKKKKKLYFILKPSIVSRRIKRNGISRTRVFGKGRY